MGKQKDKLQQLVKQLEESVDSRSIGSPLTKMKIQLKDKSQIISSIKTSKSRRRKYKKKLAFQKQAVAVANLSSTHRKSSNHVETIVFENPEKHSYKKYNEKQILTPETSNDIDIRKTRFEIIKFSMNTLKGSEKEDAETSLAISLGAERPKKSYLNYKDLQQIRKKEKQTKEEEEASLIKPDLKPKSNKKKQQKVEIGKGKAQKNNQQTKSSRPRKNPGKIPVNK